VAFRHAIGLPVVADVVNLFEGVRAGAASSWGTCGPVRPNSRTRKRYPPT